MPPLKDAKKLTICSAVYDEHSVSCLEKNLELTANLNPRADYCWLIAINNSNMNIGDRLARESVELIQGVVDVQKSIPISAAGSYQHGSSLNILTMTARTRFVLILDPDFYVVRKTWIKEFIEYALSSELQYIGAPWHPRWYSKYRYFPCTHFLFLDGSCIDFQALDFRPAFALGGQKSRSNHSKKKDSGSAIRRLANAFKSLFLISRFSIGTSKDTGYRVYRRFYGDENAAGELLTPIYEPRIQFDGPAYAKTVLNSVLESILPDSLRFFPRRRRYYRRTGGIGLSQIGWEEFLWNGIYFGFHVRGSNRSNRGQDELYNIDKSLGRFELRTHDHRKYD